VAGKKGRDDFDLGTPNIPTTPQGHRNTREGVNEVERPQSEKAGLGGGGRPKLPSEQEPNNGTEVYISQHFPEMGANSCQREPERPSPRREIKNSGERETSTGRPEQYQGPGWALI